MPAAVSNVGVRLSFSGEETVIISLSEELPVPRRQCERRMMVLDRGGGTSASTREAVVRRSSAGQPGPELDFIGELHISSKP